MPSSTAWRRASSTADNQESFTTRPLSVPDSWRGRAPERADSSRSLAAAIDEACARIAPSWPLDRLIAVNPYWGFVGQPIDEVSARLGSLAGSSLTMPRAWYRTRLDTRTVDDTQLQRALDLTGTPLTPRALRAGIETADPPRWEYPLLPELADELRDVAHHVTWRDYVVQDVSAACGAYFGSAHARWSPDTSEGLYALWQQLASINADAHLLLGERGVGDAVRALPRSAMPLIQHAVELAGVPTSEWSTWFTALLMRVSGWASVCAHRRWEARLHGGDDHLIVELLAVQLAWEVVLLRLHRSSGIAVRRDYAREAWQGTAAVLHGAQRGDWAAQRALEGIYQLQLLDALRAPKRACATVPSAHVVFCIDVRSEVMRRALEDVAPSVQTIGFAGFFGLPIAYARADAPPRPQLPGLLAPSLVVRDVGDGVASLTGARRWRARIGAAWTDVMRSAVSPFSAVEATGLGYVAALLRRAIGATRGTIDPLRADVLSGSAGGAVAPRLTDSISSAAPVDGETRVQLAAAILRGMSLTQGFGRLVALVGHGATTTNNPQGAALACGACGGQSGEVNARAVAALLNETDVRRGLAARSIHIPATTHFIAALHDTITDDVLLFDLDTVPATHVDDARALAAAFERAADRTRRERAPRLGLASLADDPGALRRALARRAADWSEVRPEWGLARNAAFIAAPRARTRGRSLGGRVFLHEYRWEEDPSGTVLTQILTAPMVVAHWINMQYYASTVDPLRYGSGDKVLHDVAGSTIGVFEGAGGDLRIGLAEQSLHDGSDWVHEPLRLTVVIEAPTSAIDAVIAQHAVVRDLVNNGWVHLLQLEGEEGACRRRTPEGWVAVG